MKILAIAQARMGSTRMPGKVMHVLGTALDRAPMLRWTIAALNRVPEIDNVVLATSDHPYDNVIADYCFVQGIACFRGSETDVLDRFYQCAMKYRPDAVIRVTCDCPFLDSDVISQVIRLKIATGADYVSNIDPPTYPDGLDVECFSFSALAAAHAEAVRASDRDCVPQYIVRNRHRFTAATLRCPLPGLEKERWVVDTANDMRFAEEIAKRLDGTIDQPSLLNILRILDAEPELRKINGDGIRNERFFAHVHSEELPRERSYAASQALLQRSCSVIPFGSQTFSKSHLQFPPGRAPLYVTHGDGARIFDVDGNDYVDLVNAILPVILGYRDQDVDDAIRHQIDRGISFSLATPLEYELAELLKRHIPCAEMAKFGKSGTDVTSAAIRLARACTDRDRIIMTGYHGWADWSMAPTDRNLGIPGAVQALSTRLDYGDYDAFEKHLNNTIAAVIVEPDSNPEFLHWLKNKCDSVGAILIFDEIITGFRWSMGGAQKFFGITPDLATFGKAMGNGMPISALVGSARLMKKMQPPDNIFYSGTMFGETLSLAAAIATIKKLDRLRVPRQLWTIGQSLAAAVQALIISTGVSGVVHLNGWKIRNTLSFSDYGSISANKIRTLFMQEMSRNGVLIINAHNLSYAIGAPELARITTAYAETFMAIKNAMTANNIDNLIGEEAPIVAPLRAVS
jgi:glutamate-1-semialdehyde aminotransferase/spore coat polysaccharide biosynthesis protein SpsF (cytidylyltransferase family)